MQFKHLFSLSPLMLAMAFQVHAQEDISEKDIETNNKKIEQMTIVGVRSDRVSKGATGLTMEVNETPQSISVISAEQIKNFAANNLNDALKLSTGITVEEWETNRTNYTSRGFDIKNTQIDGVGMPNGWGIVTGAMESYGYDEIEVIRGANGLLTGVGNSAGTINYVRKRPTNENQGEVGVSIGSYDFKRVQADYSVLLTESGSWAARVVAVIEDKESYLEGLANNRNYFYGVIDGQLTENSTLAAGFSYQDANTDGNMWGGLVFNYTDGTQAQWSRNTTTTQAWTTWDTENTSAFVEYAYVFDNDWEVKATYNKQIAKDPSKLFYVSGEINKDTGLGLNGWPGRYEDEFDADLLDINLQGEYSLFGNNHEANLGASTSKSTTNSYTHQALSGFGATPAFPYSINAIAEPTWGDKTQYANIDMTVDRIFGSTKLSISNSLFVVAGFNAIDFTRKGTNSGVVIENDESEISPYIGMTYHITPDINFYMSYSDIYQPQEQYDYDGYFLDPTKGVNYETGFKTQWLDDNLLVTFAIFAAEQENFAIYAGVNANQKSYYKGVSLKSKGIEVELVGHITDNLNANVGYTHVNIEDHQGQDTNEWIPKNTVNFTLDYTLPQLNELTFGLGGKWQSDIENKTYAVKQNAYLLVNAFARWNITEQLNVQANINNITDEKYINSLYNVGYYGAPANGTINLTYSF